MKMRKGRLGLVGRNEVFFKKLGMIRDARTKGSVLVQEQGE